MNINYFLKKQINSQHSIHKLNKDAACIYNNEFDEEKFKVHLILMIKEAFEVFDEINYKPHMKKKQINFDKIKEELIDVFKYYLNLIILLGIDFNEIDNIFTNKTKKIIAKIKKESEHELDNDQPKFDYNNYKIS